MSNLWQRSDAEEARLRALDAYQILNTERRPAFDRLTRLAARLFGTPIALVSFVARDALWCISTVGMPACEVARDGAFCDHAIRTPGDVFVVLDATTDPRFRNSPLVTGGPLLRFYAGVPLQTPDGYAIGSFCVLDDKPRAAFGPEEQQALRDLADLVMEAVEAHRKARVRDQEAARERSALIERFATVEETAPFAIIKVDLAGRVVGWNPAAEAMFGWSAEEALGRVLPQVSEGQMPAALGLMKQVTTGSGIAGRQTVRSHRDGHEIAVSGAFAPLRDADGRIIGAVGIYEDMTKADLAATRHLQLRRRYEAVVDATVDAILVADASGAIVAWNRGAARLFGWEADDIIGRPLQSIMPERFHAAHAAGMARVAKSGRSALAGRPLELEARRRDGSVFPIELTLATWEEEGRLMVGGIIRDIGERRLVEAERAASAEALSIALEAAETASRAKSDLLATMSHELRTPLNAVLGFAELIRDGSAMLAPAKTAQFASNIHLAGDHLLRIIVGILDYAEADRGTLPLRLVELRLDDLARECIDRLRDAADTARVQIVDELTASIPTTLGDWERLSRVIGHILSNAVKFTAPGGRITIVGGVDDGGLPFLSIADTGIGMSPEEQASAATPFWQAGGSLRRYRQEGIGMGLPLCRRLVALHGGTLTIDSTPGIGTTVTMTLSPVVGVSADAIRRAS